MSFLGDELSTVRRSSDCWLYSVGGCYSGDKFSIWGRYAEVGGVDGLVAGGRGMSHWDTMHRFGSVGG